MNPQAFDLAMAKVFGKDWKSTWSAYLTIFMVVGAFIVKQILDLPNPHPWMLTLAGFLTALVAIAKAILGHMTIDAGSTLVMSPDGVKPAPSHEVPDVPGQIPVKEK